MSLLTDQEIRAIQAQHPTENDPMPFARALITATVDKLAAGVNVEPVAWTYKQNLRDAVGRGCQEVLLYAGNNSVAVRAEYGTDLFTQSQLQTAIAAATQQLRQAAQAVVDRWDTPLWKDAPATADYIYALREALNTPPEAA
jgi:hypothetical protein